MYRRSICVVSVVSLFGLSGCNAVFGVEPGQLAPTFDAPAEIDGVTTWTRDQIPVLKDIVRVKTGATLIIEAGTRIYGENNSGLFIDLGAKIIAKGTKEDPIVFTVEGTGRKPGAWRGLYLCGNAPINGASANGFTTGAVPDTFVHGCGGPDPDDSSGELHYVRIEFPGDGSNADNAAGIEFIGVGRKTSVDHVQVHLAGEDAFVIYGGTVEMKYMLATGFGDDAFDWAYGWQGRGQFLAAHSLRNDGGFEGGDNPGDSFQGAGTSPSSPVIYNATLAGTPDDTSSNIGVTFQDATKGKFANVLLADFGELGLRVRSSDTKDNAVAKTLDMSYSIFANSVNFPDMPNFPPDPWLESTWLTDLAQNNRILMPGAHGIRSLSPISPDFSVTGEALTGAATPPDDGFFDSSATFVGACGDSCSEFAGWTGFPTD